MKKSATCFFSYSWDDKEIYDVLLFLKTEIENISKNTVTVILDRLNYKYNDDLDDKLEEMKSYDLIITFFTPSYKANILEINSRQSAKEFKIIEELFEEDNNRIFPVVFSGKIETSLPSIFNNKICPLISDFEIQKTSKTCDKLSVPRDKKKSFNKFLIDLVSLAKLNSIKHSNEYKTATEAMQKLFYLTNTTQLPASCLIKMEAYEKVKSQSCYFVVGRKGSGKSTFLSNLNAIEPTYFLEHYKKLAPICADNLNLEHIYKIIQKHSADEVEIPSKELICLFWELLFVLLCIYVIGIEDEEGNIIDNRAAKFRPVIKKLKELLGLKTTTEKYLSFKKDGILKLLSTTAIEFIDDSFKSAIINSNEQNFIPSFKANLSPTAILNEKLGEPLLDEFAIALESCKKHIIISIDGFDKESESFRQQTQYLERNNVEYQKRLNFEISFYSQLLEIVSKFKFQVYNDPLQNVLQDKLDFCIVLPKDRYDQIIALDRDSAKKQFCSLDWDEYDLMELITTRLEYLIKKRNGGGFGFPKFTSLKERFEFALNTYCPNIPTTVSINVDGNAMSFDMFNYIVRQSFWRPRDIIYHFSKILPIFEENSTDDPTVKNELLKLLLKESSRNIIRDEFIKEYKNVFFNLEHILHKFDNKNLISEASEFIDILSEIRFNATFSYDLNDIKNKLYLLYQLGVIGLYFDDVSYKSFGCRSNLCYIYNEGLEPIERFIRKANYDISNPKIILNPIFIEYLSLEVNSKKLIGNFEWSYIDQTHKLRHAIRRI